MTPGCYASVLLKVVSHFHEAVRVLSAPGMQMRPPGTLSPPPP